RLVAVLDGDLDVVAALLHRRPRERVAGAEVAEDVERTAVRRSAELVDGCRPALIGRGGPGDPLADQRGIVTRCQRYGTGREAAVLQGLDPQPGGGVSGGLLSRRDRPAGLS